MDPATSADLRELATAVRDLADSVIVLSERVDKIGGRVESMGKDVGLIAAPTATFFETRNREHAQAEAEAAEAGSRKRATLNEWLAWLTPKRAAAIILALASAGLCGGPATGMAGKAQSAYKAAATALLSEASP